MTNGFLNDILQQLLRQKVALSETLFVLPSKRAGSFLKDLLKTQTDYSGFTPEVLSIEEFISEVTGLKNCDATQSIFQFYEVYKTCTPAGEREDFETFLGWAQTLIYDFNEIDRYLIDTEEFFGYLANIQELEHWSMAQPHTELVANYLKFWNKLPAYHREFTKNLLNQNWAYQGLNYRKAAEKIDDYLLQTDRQIIFIGFNALNTAEQKIFQKVLSREKGQVFWDIDSYFLQDYQHEAGLFMRNYRKNWSYYQDKEFTESGTHYTQPKEIQIIGVSKNIGQVKEVGRILKTEKAQNTAVVLNDEGLLLPLLNSLPLEVDGVNITMGLPLEKTPLSSLFEILFNLQKDRRDQLYYKNILDVITHPAVKLILKEDAVKIKDYITQGNFVFVKLEDLLQRTRAKHHNILRYCFEKTNNRSDVLLTHFLQLTEALRPQDPEQYALETEYLFHFNRLFKKLENLFNQYGTLYNLPIVYRLYKEALQTAMLDFQGSPFEGLQIMGMLETRVLDYDTVILTSVNEGILPSGKSTNSFIPYDLKRKYRLPTYREKDAVYSYHFYRLLQRAKKVYLLYNTDKSGSNAGEKSRFISQLEVEHPKTHQLEHHIRGQNVVRTKKEPEEIEKTPEVLRALKNIAEKGFSPSALITYIRNPIEFYRNYILQIKEQEDIEETIAANTLGTVVHNTLEVFYKPLESKEVTLDHLSKMKEQIEKEVARQFSEVYSNAPLTEGKNLIIFEVAKRFVHNFIQQEQENVKKGRAPKIRFIESSTLIHSLEMDELDFPVYIRGVVDRVDEVDQQIRIIDFKTGKVESKQLRISDWQDILDDYKYAMAFQVLLYASLLFEKIGSKEIQAGIISFKNLKMGFMPFEDKVNKSQKIDKEVIYTFNQYLKQLILEILNPEIPFKEKEV